MIIVSASYRCETSSWIVIIRLVGLMLLWAAAVQAQSPAPSPGPPPPGPCSPTNLSGTSIAVGVMYYDCSGNDPAVHIVTIDRSLPAVEIRILADPLTNAEIEFQSDTHTLDGTIKVTERPLPPPLTKYYSASGRADWLHLTHISDLARSANAVVAINGFQWHGNQGANVADGDNSDSNRNPEPMGVPNTSIFTLGQLLNTDPNPCPNPSTQPDPTSCEVFMGFASGGPSGVQVERIKGADLDAIANLTFRYQMYGSDTHAMENNVCGDDPRSDRWSIIGYSDTQIVFVSATDNNYTEKELCEKVLRAFGVTDAVRNDGGHSPNLYVRGRGVVNPNGQIPNAQIYGGEPRIAYALGLVEIPPTTMCSDITDSAGLLFGRLCITPDNTGYNAEFRPVDDGLSRCGSFDFNLVFQDSTRIGDQGAFRACSSDSGEHSYYFATGAMGCAVLDLFEQNGDDFGTTEWFTQGCVSGIGIAGPPGYTFCSNENGTCSFSGMVNVAYGANGTFFYQGLSSGTACNNGVFGDPAPGAAKACFYQVPIGPPGYTFCSAENGTCSFSGPANVAYGANGAFFYENFTNGIACNDSVFGDPTSGTFKDCFYQSIAPPPPPNCGNGDGLYCGGNGVNGDQNTLFRCSGGNVSAVSSCAHGCQRMPSGFDDLCAPFASHPSAMEKVNSDVNVFYPGGDGNRTLHMAYWNSANGWNDAAICGGRWTAGSPSAVEAAFDTPTNPYGTVRIYYKDAGTLTLHECRWDPATLGWSDLDMGQPIQDSPSAIVDPIAQTVNVFYHTSDMNLHESWLGSDGWHDWAIIAQDTGGTRWVSGSPAAIIKQNGQVNVFYHDAGDNLLHVLFRDRGGAWTDVGLGQPITNSPTAVEATVQMPTNNAGTVRVYFRGNDQYGTMMEWSWNPVDGSWNVYNTGRWMANDAAVVQDATGKVDVYYDDSGPNPNVLWEYYLDGTQWNVSSGSCAVCGNRWLAASPTALAKANGDVNVFYRDTGDGLLHMSYRGAYTGWNDASFWSMAP